MSGTATGADQASSVALPMGTNGASESPSTVGLDATVGDVPRSVASALAVPSSIEAGTQLVGGCTMMTAAPIVSQGALLSGMRTVATKVVSPVPILPYPSLYIPMTVPMQQKAGDSLPSDNLATSAVSAEGVANLLANGFNTTADGTAGANSVPTNGTLSGLAERELQCSGAFSTVIDPSVAHVVSSSTNKGVNGRCGPRRRGRPPGAKNKKRRVELKMGREVSGILKKGRGSSFSQEEALKLAKAWVMHASNMEHQSDMTMWGAIHTTCRTEHNMDRTTESLRCAWGRLARDAQLFLSARGTVRAQNAHASVEEVNMLAQDLYRREQGRKDEDGNIVNGAPFKYIEAADYLSTQRKFTEEKLTSGQWSACWVDGGIDGDELTELHGIDGGLGGQVGGRSNTDLLPLKLLTPISDADVVRAGEDGECEQDRGGRIGGENAQQIAQMVDKNRPLGFKKMKQRDRMQEEGGKMRAVLIGIEKQLKRANDLYEQSLRRDEDTVLLTVLPKDSAEYKDILNRIMKRRSKEEEEMDFEHVAEANDGSGELIGSGGEETNMADGRSDVVGMCTELDVENDNNCNM